MAEKPKSSRDNFIAKIVKDPKLVPDTLLLNGYLGDSSEDKHTRLYFDAQLSSYVEIPEEAILHTQDYPSGSSPLGGSYVWIKKDAVLIHSKKAPEKIRAKFLDGPIVKDYMRAAVGPGDGGDGGDGGIDNTVAFCPETFSDLPCGFTSIPIVCTINQIPTQQNCITQVYPCTPITTFCHTTNPKLCNIHVTNIPACHIVFTRTNCQVKAQQAQPAAQQAQPMGVTFNGHNCPTIIACNYTHTGAVCPTHMLACFPTAIPVLCHTHAPVCLPHNTIVGCPQLSLNCPTFGACPSIACGFGPGGNPGY
jgi:hypothetical protein